MKKLFSIFSFVFIVGLSDGFSQLDPKEQLQMGIASFNGREYLEAVKYLTNYLETVSSDKMAMTYRAYSYYYLGNYQDGLADATNAIANDNSYALAHNVRGLIYTAMNNFPEAINDFTEAIFDQPDLAEAYMNRGLVYKAMKEYPQAVTDLSSAIDLNNTLLEAYYYRGEIEVYMGNYDAAIKDLNIVVMNRSNDAASLAARGLALYQTKQYKQAAEDLENAININPNLRQDYETVLEDAKRQAAEK